jgi:5-methylcytosine-specific restriction enzyme A
MPLLYYWRPDNYARDRVFGFGYHLNQNSAAMAAAQPGASLWAFTRLTRASMNVLAAELVVRALTRNPRGYRYGTYRIWGDIQRSRYFDIDRGRDVEPIIRALTVPTRGEQLGQSFQGNAAVRLITESDHRLLAEFSRDLPVLERVAIYPEDEFEARLVYGSTAGVLKVAEERTGYAQRLHYLNETVDVRRSRRNVERLQGLYDGRCQLCLYDPRNRYGHALCHGHHIQWLSRNCSPCRYGFGVCAHESGLAVTGR